MTMSRPVNFSQPTVNSNVVVNVFLKSRRTFLLLVTYNLHFYMIFSDSLRGTHISTAN